MSTEHESQEPQSARSPFRRALTSWRLWLAGVIGLTGVSALTTRVILDELQKGQAAASEAKQPGEVVPSSAEALSKQGIIIPDFTTVPATVTATPPPTETPPATATATETATPEPTQTPLPKEKPTSLTADNFSEFVSTVSNDEFQKLAKSQPDAFAFPVKPLSEDFNATYIDRPAKSESTKGNYKSITITGSNNEILSPIEGEVQFLHNDPRNKDKITHISISKEISAGTTLKTYIFIGDSNIVPIANDGQIDKGAPLLKASGKIVIDIYLSQKLDQSIIIERADGGKTGILAYTTYLAPSIFENTGWVGQNGKAVIPQN